MENDKPAKDRIIKLMTEKSNIKASIFDVVQEVFNSLKELLGEISNDLNESFDDIREKEGKVLNKRIKLEYRDRGKFEAELRFADDVLIFSMHPDVFQFNPSHKIWDAPYSRENQFNTYCGIIDVYNFLYDSVKYDRDDDTGYLVARMFVNREKAFFVEGQKQPRSKVEDFGRIKLEKAELQEFVESAMLYSISFDLFVPPYGDVDKTTVEQINSKIEDGKTRTGKRFGYDYSIDDIIY